MRKYELLRNDYVEIGDRRVYRVQALRNFGDVKRGDLGGFIECERNLSHEGEAWVYDHAQIYGDNALVRGNGRVRGCAWVMGIVEDSGVVDDLAIVCEGARVGGREILLYDDVARKLEPVRSAMPGAKARALAMA